MQPPSLPATETWGHCPFPRADMGPGLGAWAGDGVGSRGLCLEGQALEGSEGTQNPWQKNGSSGLRRTVVDTYLWDIPAGWRYPQSSEISHRD